MKYLHTTVNEQDTTRLKDLSVQEEYRAFIQQKVTNLTSVIGAYFVFKLDSIPQSDSDRESDSDKKVRTDAQANVIILISMTPRSILVPSSHF